MAKIIEIDMERIVKAFSQGIEVYAYRTMRYTLEDVVSEWYASNGSNADGYSMFQTFEFKTTSSVKGEEADITITSWSEPDRYRGASADGIAWASRHGYSAAGMNLFVYDLQMNQGIIGLPAYASVWDSTHDEPFTSLGLGWVDSWNVNYNQTTPLAMYIPTSELWRKWEDDIVDKLSSLKVSL